MPTNAITVVRTAITLWYQSVFANNLPTLNASYTVPSAVFKNTDGTTFNTSGKHIIRGGRPPEWLIAQESLVEVFVTGSFAYYFTEKTVVNGSATNHVLPSWSASLPTNVSKFVGFTGSSGTNYWTKRLFQGQFETSFWVGSSALNGTIYRDADYDFIVPPAGLAAALQSTQSFQPYAGEIGIAEEELGVTRYRGKVININGALTEHASMKAMVQGVNLDTATGRSSLTLGSPARLSYQGLVNRFRRTASDNIVYV